MFEDVSTGMLFLGFIVVLLILAISLCTDNDKEARWLLEGSKHYWPGVKDEEREFKKIKKRTVLASWLGLLFFGIYALLIGITLIRRVMGP